MLDCIIIGTGPAGISAAINLKTYKKNFIWFGSKSLSDKIIKAEKIINYPGFPSISGEQLFEKFNEHIKSAKLEITEKTVTSVVSAGKYFMVLADNEIYETKTVIIATGVMSSKVLKGEDELLGKGVSYCATCDGFLYSKKKIAVICNTPKFEHEVEYLAQIASEVYYFPTFESKLSKENIYQFNDSPIAILGEEKVEKLVLKSGKEIAVDGVFCLRNAISPAHFISNIKTEKSHISVDKTMQTNINGCFACGDCVGLPYQYAKAVGEGNIAAHSVIKYLSK